MIGNDQIASLLHWVRRHKLTSLRRWQCALNVIVGLRSGVTTKYHVKRFVCNSILLNFTIRKHLLKEREDWFQGHYCLYNPNDKVMKTWAHIQMGMVILLNIKSMFFNIWEKICDSLLSVYVCPNINNPLFWITQKTLVFAQALSPQW